MRLDMYEMSENRILIGEYQMANKRKLNKEERKRRRLQKGNQWLLTYQGTPKHMVKHYRERFHVDSMTAVKDLQELGVNYTQEQLDNIKQAEEERLKQKRLQKEKKKREKYETIYEDCDDRFAFIAGYTSGGAPYGTTWEEMGIDPELPFEEKVERLAEGDYSITEEDETNWDDEITEMLVLPGLFSVCQVEDYSQVDLDAEYCFIGKTDEEKSLVCRTGDVPDNTIQQSDGWRAFRIKGVLDFSLIGILAEISGALARYEVGLFAISTFNTDYILVKDKDYKRAVKALTSEAYRIIEME